MNLLQSMSAVYILSNRLDATKSSSGPFYSLQFRWSCSGEYDFSDDSETTYTVRISSTVPSAKIPSLYALDTALIVLCSASIGLSMLNLYKSYQVYAYAKRRLELEPEDGSDNTLMWSSVHLRDKVAFFNLWHTWLIAGNLALIIAAIQSVVPGTEDLDRAHRDLNSQQLARSLGTFFALFSVVKYMEHYLEFYMLVIAVRSSFVRVVKFVLMIMWVFLRSGSARVTHAHTHARTLLLSLLGSRHQRPMTAALYHRHCRGVASLLAMTLASSHRWSPVGITALARFHAL